MSVETDLLKRMPKFTAVTSSSETYEKNEVSGVWELKTKTEPVIEFIEFEKSYESEQTGD